MNETVKREILDKIKSYGKIVISRHKRPDGDAIGSTKGLKRILNLSFPEKKVYLINEDYSDYLSFLGTEDSQLSDEQYGDVLQIVLDTANTARISNSKIGLAKELVKIDHHIDITPYGNISWVEEERSSTCEMVVDFYWTFRNELKLDREAATYLYAGMVTDSGRFKFSSTTGETMRYAGLLLDQGIDTASLYAHLYLEDYAYLKFEADAYKKMRMTENGVAFLHVTEAMQRKYQLTSEQASNAISLLDSIENSIIWLAFIDYADSIRVRLRSRFVTINELAEKYHGGGHDRAAGATVYSRKEMQALLKDADELIRTYKESHEGWM